MAKFKNCRLILSVKDAEDHEKWLKTRDLGIGGSDAAVIMGLNPYKSSYKLWMEKTGQAEPEDLTGIMSVYWGTKNEPAIADWFQERKPARRFKGWEHCKTWNIRSCWPM